MSEQIEQDDDEAQLKHLLSNIYNKYHTKEAAFKAIDQNDSGYIEINEFTNELKNYFNIEDEQQINQLFISLDVDRDSKIGQDDWALAFQCILPVNKKEMMSQELFSIFDKTPEKMDNLNQQQLFQQQQFIASQQQYQQQQQQQGGSGQGNKLFSKLKQATSLNDYVRHVNQLKFPLKDDQNNSIVQQAANPNTLNLDIRRTVMIELQQSSDKKSQKKLQQQQISQQPQQQPFGLFGEYKTPIKGGEDNEPIIQDSNPLMDEGGQQQQEEIVNNIPSDIQQQQIDEQNNQDNIQQQYDQIDTNQNPQNQFQTSQINQYDRSNLFNIPNKNANNFKTQNLGKFQQLQTQKQQDQDILQSQFQQQQQQPQERNIDQLLAQYKFAAKQPSNTKGGQSDSKQQSIASNYNSVNLNTEQQHQQQQLSKYNISNIDRAFDIINKNFEQLQKQQDSPVKIIHESQQNKVKTKSLKSQFKNYLTMIGLGSKKSDTTVATTTSPERQQRLHPQTFKKNMFAQGQQQQQTQSLTESGLNDILQRLTKKKKDIKQLGKGETAAQAKNSPGPCKIKGTEFQLSPLFNKGKKSTKIYELENSLSNQRFQSFKNIYNISTGKSDTQENVSSSIKNLTQKYPKFI